MSDRNSSPEQREAFGAALIEAAAIANVDLDEILAIASKSKIDSAKKVVYHWRTGEREPSRPQVRELERLCKLSPGSLSRHLGWVPLEAAESEGIELAVLRNETLSDAQKQALLQILATFGDSE
jgi:hypothetical protein